LEGGIKWKGLNTNEKARIEEIPIDATMSDVKLLDGNRSGGPKVLRLKMNTALILIGVMKNGG